MQSQSPKLEFAKYAIQVMAERSTPVEWVARVIAGPALRVPDPNDPR